MRDRLAGFVAQSTNTAQLFFGTAVVVAAVAVVIGIIEPTRAFGALFIAGAVFFLALGLLFFS